MLIEDTLPAEIERGCVFSENFKNASKVVENGGAITGAPSFNNGIVLDGSNDYVSYNNFDGKLNSASVSFVVRFTPDFDYDENIERFFFDSTDSNRFFVTKRNNGDSNVLRIRIAHGSNIDIPAATYSGSWNVNEENILVITSINGDTSVWLNGTQILTNNATAWSNKNPTEFYIGSNFGSSLFFDGTIHEFKIFKTQLTDQEALDYSNGGDFWNYKNEAIFIYNGQADGYDITNKKVLDRSGNGRDANLGDGSTVSTFPTKLSHTPAYEFDGSNDYIDYSDETFPSGTEGTIFVMANVLDNSGDVRIWSTNDSNGGNYEFRTYSTAGDDSSLLLLIPIGAAGSPILNNIPNFRFNQIQTLANTWSYESPTTTAKAYRNGMLEDTDTTNNTVRPPNDAFEGGKWGTHYSKIQLFYMAGWIKPLTQIQIIDLHLKVFRGINDL